MVHLLIVVTLMELHFSDRPKVMVRRSMVRL
jgi:hypothetical protein